jgi:hypothetical protein
MNQHRAARFFRVSLQQPGENCRVLIAVTQPSLDAERAALELDPKILASN